MNSTPTRKMAVSRARAQASQCRTTPRTWTSPWGRLNTKSCSLSNSRGLPTENKPPKRLRFRTRSSTSFRSWADLAQEHPRLLAPLLLEARPDELPQALPELRGQGLEMHAGPVQVGLDLGAVDDARPHRQRGLSERELEGQDGIVLEKARALQEGSGRAHVHDADVAPVLSEPLDTSAQRQARGAARRIHATFDCNTGAGPALSRVRISA